jgi:hypothetical protein
MFLALPEIKFNFQLPVLKFDIQPAVLNGSNSTQTPTISTATTLNTNTKLDPNSSETETLLRLIHAEAGGERIQKVLKAAAGVATGGDDILGMAAVAKSILNREKLVASGKVEPGTFNAKGAGLTAIISAANQYQPYGEGKLNTALSAADRDKALQALNLALNTEEFKKQLQASGKSADEINKIMAATGFRAGYAFNDASQNVNNVALGNHTFNTAGNAQLTTYA